MHSIKYRIAICLGVIVSEVLQLFRSLFLFAAGCFEPTPCDPFRFSVAGRSGLYQKLKAICLSGIVKLMRFEAPIAAVAAICGYSQDSFEFCFLDLFYDFKQTYIIFVVSHGDPRLRCHPIACSFLSMAGVIYSQLAGLLRHGCLSCLSYFF